MEYFIGLFVLVFGGMIYFKNKADKARRDAILGKARGKDKVLKAQHKEVDQAKRDLEEGIERIKEDRKKERDRRTNMTDNERAEEWNNE